MANTVDITPELIARVDEYYRARCIANASLPRLAKKLEEGKATYDDAYKYAEAIGQARADAFAHEVNSEVLPDGKMYYNIAEQLMDETLSADHEAVAEYAAGVQEIINEQGGISLAAQKADLDKDRIKGFIEGICNADIFDDVAWKLGQPVVTHARSVVDDTVKKNAEFQGRAGIKATVIRKAEAKCCKWCSGIDGDYVYPDVPSEVFQRHDNCRCTVDYKGRRLTAYNSGWKANTFRDQGEQERIDARKQRVKNIEEAFAQKSSDDRQKRGIINKEKEKREILRIPQIPASTISAKVANGEYSLRLSQQSYDKHIPGTKTYAVYLQSRQNKGLNPQSVLTISKEEAQEIIIRQSGTGIIKVRRDGTAMDVEQITCDRIIGYYYQEGKQISTNKAAIHHGRRGSHLVPIKGNHYD